MAQGRRLTDDRRPTARTAPCSARMRLEVDAGGASRSTPRDFPTNRGGLCQKGWTTAAVLHGPGPHHHAAGPRQRRRAGSRRPGTRRSTSSPAGSRRSADAHGADAVAVFGGGGLTNEKAYQLGKFARAALGTRHIDYNGRFCMSLGGGRGQPGLRDRPRAAVPARRTSTTPTPSLLVGSNVAETMPPAVQHLARRARAAAGSSWSTRASRATAALTADGGGRPSPAAARHRPPAAARPAAPRRRRGAGPTRTTSRRRTTGCDDVRRSRLPPWWPERVAATTGVPETRAARGRASRWPTLLRTGRTRARWC